MSEERLPPVSYVEPALIEVGERLRPVSEAAVEALIASIGDLGMMKDPIHVRRVRHQDNRLVLVAGGHRLEAAKRLEWTAIPAFVRQMTDAEAAMTELDDNLYHAELSPLELAVFSAKRKQLYLKLHPETRQGLAPRLQRNSTSVVASFAATIAEKRGITERQVRNIIAAGEGLDAREVELLRRGQRAPSLKDLLALRKAVEPEKRRAAIERFATGDEKTIARALKEPVQDRPDYEFQKQSDAIQTAWARASKRARKQFLALERKSILALLDEARE